MRVDFAILALSLLTSVAASAIDPLRQVERVDLTSSANEHDLFKRRGGNSSSPRSGPYGGRTVSGALESDPSGAKSGAKPQTEPDDRWTVGIDTVVTLLALPPAYLAAFIAWERRPQ
ncbi:hypothetical protein EDB81DRAFT_822046 [Dactylonectria macrodidyma]|uniref:Uncharacterized protein n=1 Tax=Dactylonectria macrodidyma TaxID=307937 RepID=A0A9P9IC71_9HYPO|nr:hypothetical protein EDB81DRAFT_822046 [Dactylonectria macrodidyma]